MVCRVSCKIEIYDKIHSSSMRLLFHILLACTTLKVNGIMMHIRYTFPVKYYKIVWNDISRLIKSQLNRETIRLQRVSNELLENGRKSEQFEQLRDPATSLY